MKAEALKNNEFLFGELSRLHEVSFVNFDICSHKEKEIFDFLDRKYRVNS